MANGSSLGNTMVVLTVDDHPLVRSALQQMLRVVAEHVELLEACNPDEGLALLRRRPDIDLIFLDLNFSQHKGLQFVQRFRAAAPAAPLIVYTMYEDAPTLKQALAFGACGIVPKTHSTALLQKAIELVMEGGVYVPPELARQLADGAAGPPLFSQSVTAKIEMSSTQWRILELLERGAPNKEIAKDLNLSASTVKHQLTVIFQKLGVSNRTQAARAAHTLLQDAGIARYGGSAAGSVAE
jgi:DNA-binding NarL/FixJ family response regulator